MRKLEKGGLGLMLAAILSAVIYGTNSTYYVALFLIGFFVFYAGDK